MAPVANHNLRLKVPFAFVPWRESLGKSVPQPCNSRRVAAARAVSCRITAVRSVSFRTPVAPHLLSTARMELPFLSRGQRKREHIVSIDLGGRTTKAVYLQRKGERFALVSYAILDAPISDKAI